VLNTRDLASPRAHFVDLVSWRNPKLGGNHFEPQNREKLVILCVLEGVSRLENVCSDESGTDWVLAEFERVDETFLGKARKVSQRVVLFA
jgi:hypothetical protein